LDLIGSQLIELPLLVIVARELVSLLTFLDLPLEEALGIAVTSR